MAYLLRAVNVIPTSSTEADGFVCGAIMLVGAAGGPWREDHVRGHHIGPELHLAFEDFLEKT